MDRKLKNFLIVEDETFISNDIKNILKNNNYKTIKQTKSYSETVELLETFKPCIALIDIKLKGEKDGIDVATYIFRYLNIPIIFITAFATDNFINRAKFIEPCAYIIKPYTDREIISNIEIALHKFSSEKKRYNEMITAEN